MKFVVGLVLLEEVFLEEVHRKKRGRGEKSTLLFFLCLLFLLLCILR
jgi:hypothetical protein